MSKILVIDDDHDITALLKRFLTKHGHEVETAYKGEEGEKLVSTFEPDLIMSDYRLDDMDGGALLMRIRQINSDIPVIIMTGYSDLRTAVKVVRLGAYDYMIKPLIPDEVLLTIETALSAERANNAPVKSPSKSKTGKKGVNSGYLFSDSFESQKLEREITLVAPTNYTVLIYGESGAGKEGVAKLIHDRSNRKDKPFVAMDCGAISKDLAGSELFGHEKGAFTGAVGQKIGHFETAYGGTLFLDEVANLPYEVQTLLLRVIQEKSMRRIGGTKEIPVDVRLIVASNERLTKAIQQGKFRDDLYHRFNEFSIDVPSLRTRKKDILFFAKYFLEETSADLGKEIIGFEPDVEEVFLRYPWYGNIRELKNVIKRSALLSSSNRIDIKALPFEILNHAQLEFGINEPDNTESANMEQRNPIPAGGPMHSSISSNPDLKSAALVAEQEVIMAALNKVNYNKSKAAEILGINRKTLYNKMKLMNIKDR